MKNKTEIDGEISAGWQSYWGDKQKDHQTMSETVSATTDDDLHSEETVTLPEEVDEDGLTLAEKNIIEAAVVNQTMSTERLANRIEKDRSYVEDVLRETCPEWYNDVFKPATEYGDMDTPDNVTAEIRSYIRSNNGVTRSDITTALDISDSTFYNHIDDVRGIRGETGVNGYHGRTKVYYADDGGETVDITPVGDDEPAESFGDELEDLSVESDYSELQAVIAGIKATAEHEETVKALEVVEGYL
jgi:hypothetical protein